MSSLIPHPAPLLLVITGPTASGKSALALDLAERYGGEIICADSRTVYRGMDIGTAKPTLADQARVPHHLLDVANPDERFTAADFQRLARQSIVEIRDRGAIPFIVGGTGLYIDGVILDYKFGADADHDQRRKYEAMSVDQIIELLKKQHISIPHNHHNKRHLIRALEQGGINDNRGNRPSKNIIVVAIATDKHELEKRIIQRTEEIFADGIIKETTRLMSLYGSDHESMSGNIYPIIHQYIDDEISLDRAKELFIIKDRQLAKRQITWLKRHDFVRWLTLDEAREHIMRIIEGQKTPII